MKGLLGFGTPKQQRFSMQYGYQPRPSFWHAVKSNSHLIIAAVGTAALLGVAAVALWLAMPSGDRQAFADSGKAVGEALKSGTPKVVADAAAAPADKAAPKANAVSPKTAAQEAEIPVLASNDPRWSGSKPKAAVAAAPEPVAKQAFAAQTVDPAAAAAVAATAEEAAGASADAKPAAESQDGAKTAAIPTARPQKPEAQAADTKTGHIVRSVTMRSGPKKGAAALGTIPAKSSVQVMSCSKWCQVVYKGKRGWIYKSFLKRDG